MKKLLIILLLIPSIASASAKTVKSDLADKAKEACKNWETLEDRPIKEVIKCLKAVISSNAEMTQANYINIKQLYDVLVE